MERILLNTEPKRANYHFESISAIPRGSGNEKGVADYLEAFAKENGLEYYRDKLNNVLIKRDASKGYEAHPPVILQGHTDMVCEKNIDTVHDFEKDGLKLGVKDGFLYAEGTTLGADDGAAVALMLALLEDEKAEHPPLECLFTVCEETGMDGAFGFDYSLLKGRTMLNLDGEDLDVPTVSCAGGVTSVFTFECDPVKRRNKALKVTVKGLMGGHSGVEIIKGRANANLIMGRILASLYETEPFSLVAINGGCKNNAIPRECVAVISVFDPDKAKEELTKLGKEIANELSDDDAEFRLYVDKATNLPESCLSFADTSRILRAINLIPNGVLAMSSKVENLVETSSNLGIITTCSDKVTLTAMARSCVDTKLENVISKFNMLGRCVGAQVKHGDKHPGWDYARESRVREVYKDCFARLFGFEPRFEAIHAGLECGIIGRSLGGCDTVSFGPKMYDIHTPDERLDLASFDKCYKLICEMLKEL